MFPTFINAYLLQRHSFIISVRHARTQKYILALKEAGNPINTDVVLAAAESIISATDKSVLVENGGKLALTRGWAVSLLQRTGLVAKKKQGLVFIILQFDYFTKLTVTWIRKVEHLVLH